MFGIWVSAAFAEEIIFRGYLLNRFNKLTGNTIVSILSSSLLFSLIHVYQGISGLLLTFIGGILYCVIYLFAKRNLWVSILAHGISDTISLTLIYFGTTVHLI